MGATGSGKSNVSHLNFRRRAWLMVFEWFLNRATETEQVEVGHGFRSCTSDIEELFCVLDGHKYCLIDSPGFEDTYQSDTEVLKKISSWLEFTSKTSSKKSKSKLSLLT
jgi:predicted GTPase